MSKYGVVFEVAGPLAMYARPDTPGAAPVSYPAPPWSAAKGLLESIAFLNSGAVFSPTRVEICRRIGARGGEVRYQRYATNYGGPLRKSNQRTSGASFQFFATVLADVCFRIHAGIRATHDGPGANPAHHLQDLFARRLKQGRCHQTPALGWKEFTCSYWGPVRPDLYETDLDLDLTVPSMLATMWDTPRDGQLAPRFQQDARVVRGVLTYAQ